MDSNIHHMQTNFWKSIRQNKINFNHTVCTKQDDDGLGVDGKLWKPTTFQFIQRHWEAETWVLHIMTQPKKQQSTSDERTNEQKKFVFIRVIPQEGFESTCKQFMLTPTGVLHILLTTQASSIIP